MTATGKTILGALRNQLDLGQYTKVHWEGTFEQYLDIIRENPEVTRNAYQRLYDMILSHGTEEIYENKEKITRFKFFAQFAARYDDAIYGLDRTLMQLGNTFKSAAYGYGTERRVLLLHGPVGSSKSTIARLLKRGLEEYSRSDDGMVCSFSWKGENDTWIKDPMHGDPLQLIPADLRIEFIKQLSEALAKPPKYPIQVKGELCPFSRYIFNDRLQKYNGDVSAMLEGEVKVYRMVLSEQDRIGIGTFQPKDEKNQDSTELTGDLNYRKIAEYGSDSDPRAFNFDGELNIANRGLVEFIEVLKLDVAFLYDLLGASQEHKIKPKKFAQTDIDEVILGHTNEPEYRRLQNNEFMEALRDRTVKIDVPYVTRLSDEIKIYEKSFNPEKVLGKHIAPHTIEVAAMWAVLTRLEQPKHASLTLLQKMKLYNGKTLPGFTEDNIVELKREGTNEGMHGISPRYIQDKISNALVAHPEEDNINPFMVLHELEIGLRHHSLITNQDQLQHFKELLQVVKQEYEDVVKNEVQRAIAADEDALQRLWRQLHRQRQGVHPARKGPQPLHRELRGARRTAHAQRRGEDRHSRGPQGRLPPRDHELHRRPGHRRQEVRLPHQRAADEGTRAQAVRGPEGHDQADQPGVQRRGQGNSGKDRRGERPIDQVLRLQRVERHGRAQLRRQYLRSGADEEVGAWSDG